MKPEQARRMAEEVELPDPVDEVRIHDGYVYLFTKACDDYYTEPQVREAIASALVKLTQQEPVAWLYTLFGHSGEIANMEASTINWDERYRPFGRPGIDFHEDGVVRKEPLYTHPALIQQEERVQELERVLGVARDHITLLSRIANIDHTWPCASIAAIEAALSKETGK